MKEKLLNRKKIKLNREQQLSMFKFFAKTSIPRMLQSNNKDTK